jgi:hypothetical protein
MKDTVDMVFMGVNTKTYGCGSPNAYPVAAIYFLDFATIFYEF